MSEHGEAIQWAKKYLVTSLGQHILSETIIVDTPWSLVYQINTDAEVIYLKQTPS